MLHLKMKTTFGAVFLLFILFMSSCRNSSIGRVIDMKPHWNDQIPLENPHKGWYHHFPDNHINKYVIADDSDLTGFPGMDHLYIRLAWAYLEPQEGRFDWELIDQYIDKWVGMGLGIAFRISCRETSTDRIEQQFATPRWVLEAGAEGGYYRSGEQTGPDGPWEPVFDDPVFLAKLENFLQAFGARYDGKSWLRYVDVGSIGDWGEGHTHFGSRALYNFEQRKKHVDLYLKYFKKTQIVVTDDFVYNIKDPEERRRMHEYIVDKGISYRDDSILVDYYVGAYPATYTVRSPEYFEAVWRRKPTVFELEHYGTVKRQGNWLGEPGGSLAEHGNDRSGADFFRGALRLLHATYIGYHGYAHEWLADNPQLTVELLNRCGYWYFLHSVELPETWKAGKEHIVKAKWENRGVAPAYYGYEFMLRFEGPVAGTVSVPSGNQNWLPDDAGKIYDEIYRITVPEELEPGEYILKFKLFSPETKRDVFPALDPGIKDEENYCKIGEVTVVR
ncbi:DUF4832 domain-containing protein [candidate division KSB1 bacterium]|nr:DUF4832 domain-containing protein [candidate division KSB1 bacterium]